jgi:hypothetical protein
MDNVRHFFQCLTFSLGKKNANAQMSDDKLPRQTSAGQHLTCFSMSDVLQVKKNETDNRFARINNQPSDSLKLSGGDKILSLVINEK